MNGIIWIASYPKSGNTWLRIFLTNLLRDGDEPASINDLEKSPIASSRPLFDESAGCESSDLTADEIDRLRPEIYRHLAETLTEPLFMKIHDARTEVAPGLDLIPAAATAGALYLIRNPLDVTVSAAHHNGSSYDDSIARMADSGSALAHKPDRMHEQFRQKLLSWSDHVLSWTEGAPFPVCVLRYEDMRTAPLETFTRAVRFAGIDRNQAQIEKAIRFSAFDVLQKQEEAGGFKECSPRADRFFRKGRTGAWREELSAEQVRRIVSAHEAVMRRFGYLDAQGGILA